MIFQFNARSLEEALDYLIKDANGFNHPFVHNKKKVNRLCLLCKHDKDSHKKDEASNNVDEVQSLFMQAEKKFGIVEREESFVVEDKSCGICYN